MPISEIAILGGGAAGTITAIRLLESAPRKRVVLVERSSAVGLGVAYGTPDLRHRLNVRAAGMSIRPERPSDFVDWLIARGLADPSVAGRFVPRQWFGMYVQDSLDRAVVSSESLLSIVHGEAIALSGGNRLSVRLTDGAEVVADAVVLALGNLRPSAPGPLQALAGSPRWISDPWTPGMLANVGRDDRVLIVGAGLTMVDAVLSLAGQGHRGRISVRSRHGLTPRAHEISPTVALQIESGPGLVRRACRAIRSHPGGWRAAIDALRPHSNALWASLSWSERAAFKRRLQGYWDVHRHRAPEEDADLLARMEVDGRLDIQPGTIRQAARQDDRIQIVLQHGEKIERIETDWVLNCTSPAGGLAAARLPVLESAVAAGLAAYDPLGLGLIVDDDGRTSQSVWALGALCRGCRLETTAIPEIRCQACRIADVMFSGSTLCSPST